MTTRYLTVPELKDYVRSELALDDASYEAAIMSAEMILDNACQRHFEVAAVSATARVFMASGRDVLLIHDAVAITSVVDNGTTLVSGTDYQPEPLNGLSTTGEVWPYYRLRRLNSSWYNTGVTGKTSVTVTARWGWGAIPAQIKEACKVIAKDAFQQRDIRFGLVAVSEAGGVGTRENRIVRDAVAAYSHPAAFGVA